ncbi:hypothetical protein B296_00049356 [Ensete ventricosum]|uniref:Uncharacterized protein n=1 Tax=Ensete ventricosum TaxID=4639 RepID=A0A426X028_ENSVE|nr:hypothetical protein B296_00049356 [Ensete ventricosum]
MKSCYDFDSVVRGAPSNNKGWKTYFLFCRDSEHESHARAVSGSPSPYCVPDASAADRSPIDLDVQEIPIEGATRRTPKEVSREITKAHDKRPTEAPSRGGRKKRKVLGCKSQHDGEKSKAQSSKGKEPIVMVKEPTTPQS